MTEDSRKIAKLFLSGILSSIAKQQREYEDDDGRTIADMSDLPDVSIVGRWSGIHKDNAENGGLFGTIGAFGNRGGSSGSGFGGGYGGYGGGASYGGRGRHEIPAPEMDSSERRMYVLGMLKASLGIGMIYVLAFAVLLGVLVAIW